MTASLSVRAIEIIYKGRHGIRSRHAPLLTLATTVFHCLKPASVCTYRMSRIVSGRNLISFSPYFFSLVR